MIPAFTIVLEEDFDFVTAEIIARAGEDASILLVRGENKALYFAGDERVADLARSQGLACVRLLQEQRVVHVEADAYELSAADLELFLRWLLEGFTALHIFDDETGEDLLAAGFDDIEDLFIAEVEFVDLE